MPGHTERMRISFFYDVFASQQIITYVHNIRAYTKVLIIFVSSSYSTIPTNSQHNFFLGLFFIFKKRKNIGIKYVYFELFASMLMLSNNIQYY